MRVGSTPRLQLAGVLDDIVLIPRARASAADLKRAESPFAFISRLAAHLSSAATRAKLQQFAAADGLLPAPVPLAELAARLEAMLRSGTILVLRIPRRRTVATVEAAPALGPDDSAPAEVELTWIAFEVADKDGEPLKGRKFVLTLPDGSTRDGELDSYGKARMNRIPRGKCKFSLIDIDGGAWKAA